MLNHKVIDNFLPSEVFNELYGILLFSPPSGNFGTIIPQWQYTPNVDYETELSNLFGNINPSRTQLEQANDKLKDIITKKGNDWRIGYLTHLVYVQNMGGVLSPLYDKIMPFKKPFNIKALIRIKINMYLNSETLKEHGMHSDYDYSHTGAILSINTCDGYTKLEDGTKIDSVANRMLLFDASKPHSSTTTTNQTVRVNINFNYF